MENFHPHSRYTIEEYPANYPGRDIIHGTPDGPVFNLGVEIDNIHPVWAYVQVADVIEMAHVLGFISPEEALAKDRRIAELQAEVNALPKEVERLKDGLDHLTRNFLFNIADASADLDVVPVEATVAVTEVSLGEPEESDKLFELEPSEHAGDNGQKSSAPVSEGTNELSGSAKYDALQLLGIEDLGD